ncbi:tRNA pseudouridine synthase A [Arthrobacter bambusae]|uniref:tRNA pseudouridine synthase A n=1 Tax=Arthrobacter bambusae TaxID=1338426 RepID=UPI002783E28A|nr:tRNA pseudouridine synthase A [Arthrobacter bambusae]MDQ0031002.1 tRNA pseudouridine38-40 synthase [Arthrobacter bambusae]MDQ0098865.1 tRNA pseudouridine38-40 synthase [Arthrobacter bambusae]
MNERKPAAPVSGGGGFLRVRLDLSYDGGPFNGWALQPGLRTVQGSLEEGLALIVRRPVRVTVAGRTDAGVHARGQVAHIDLSGEEWTGLTRGHEIDPAAALLRRLRGALSRVLQDETGAIEVHDAGLAPEGFDARFSALWRRYSYRIADGPERWDPVLRGVTLWHKAALDERAMNSGAAALLGLQDFRAYCKPREGATTIRELQRLEFVRGSDGVLVAKVQADAFCHNMVRALVGSALRVGEGLEKPEWLHERLLAGVRDAKSVLAAPHPLVLEEVAYPSDAELFARAELTRARRE